MGGGCSPKKVFSTLRASVWSKNKGGGGRAPRASPLDPPLQACSRRSDCGDGVERCEREKLKREDLRGTIIST